MVHAEVNEGTRATPQTHSRHGWRCCPQPSSPPAAREAVCGKACSFLLHPKASIEVMAGLLLPPNEPKLSSLKSSDIRPDSLSPPPNLAVTATRFAQAGGSVGRQDRPFTYATGGTSWRACCFPGSMILDLCKNFPLFHDRAVWLPTRPPAEHPQASAGLGNQAKFFFENG